MFRWLKSIRTKLTLWYSFILLTTLGAFGLISYTYSSQQLSDNLDRSLRNEVKWVKNFIESKSSKVKPSKKFSQKPKTSQQSDQQPAVNDDKNAADADDIVWDQIYEHALVNPKKTIRKSPMNTSDRMALLTHAPLFKPEILRFVKSKISRIAVNFIPKS